MAKTLTPETIESFLNQFTGNCEYYASTLRGPRFVHTDGVQAMVEGAEAYWLVDAIASHQSPALHKKCDGFQVWTLTRKGKGFVLTCQADSNTPFLVEQKAEYTDFPIADGQSIKFYVEGDNDRQVLLLPSEH